MEQFKVDKILNKRTKGKKQDSMKKLRSFCRYAHLCSTLFCRSFILLTTLVSRRFYARLECVMHYERRDSVTQCRA